MGSATGPGTASTYRTPRSAIAFVGLLLGLAALYVWVAFVYGHGWSDLAGAIVGLVLIFGIMAYLSLLAWWWSRGWRRP